MCPFYYLWSCAVHVVENFPPHSSAHPTPSIRDLYCDVIFRLEYPATGKTNVKRYFDIGCALDLMWGSSWICRFSAVSQVALIEFLKTSKRMWWRWAGTYVAVTVLCDIGFQISGQKTTLAAYSWKYPDLCVNIQVRDIPGDNVYEWVVKVLPVTEHLSGEKNC